MSKLNFKLVPVEEKPRRFRQGSIYDPIIDEFLGGKESLVEVSVEGKSAHYLRMQLNKRIQMRGLDEQVKVSVTGEVAYMEKL
ncbi:MAG: hypothetical protein NWF12_04120 [Candidatus Bathyarchaeota archaeon]|jgi:hypothetical protein|nr:hypothetical protein [Candidatus Bathyarchaeota archaeon]